MLLQKNDRKTLYYLFNKIKLKSNHGQINKKSNKIEQILAYLEIIHSKIRKYSKKRKVVFIESCAGNCYLSFLVYYYYSKIDKRPITIHCVDKNQNLMENSEKLAKNLNFTQIKFHTSDIKNFKIENKVELVYSLHACDSATDKTLYLGIMNKATYILSVSCCQHTIKKHFRSSRYKGITKHSVFKDKLAYMVGDSLRALLLEINGYQSDIFEFTSSRYTGKNIMIRAKKSSPNISTSLTEEYHKIKKEFKITPELEKYIGRAT